MLGFAVSLIISLSSVTFGFTPAVSPHGDKVVFSYDGDLWILEDSVARRLTDSKGYEISPIWTGRDIVFVSNRYGSWDIFVMPADGSEGPRRLTYHPGYEAPLFVKDGFVYFMTWRSDFRGAVYRISLNGGTPEPVWNFNVNRITPGPGDTLIFERGFTPSWRRKYRGPANRDIWLMTPDLKFMKRITSFEGRDAYPMYSRYDGKIYFVSNDNPENVSNLFVMNTDGTGRRQLTHFKDDVMWPRISEDGKTIVLSVLGKLYIYRVDTGELKPLSFRLSADKKFSDPFYRTFKSKATEIAISPNGKELAFVVFGNIFVMNLKNREVRRITHTPEPEKDISWCPNGEKIVFASLVDGNWNLYQVTPLDDSLLSGATEFSLKRITEREGTEKRPVCSPDGKKIAFLTDQGTLNVMDEDGSVKRYDQFNDVIWISWSPDSRWIAFSRTALGWREDIYVVKVDSSMEPVNISNHPNDDYRPLWSLDGRRIAFASRDENGNLEIKYVILRKEDAEKTAEYFKTLKDSTPGEVRIDFDDIGDRIRTVYTFKGGYNYFNQDKWGLNFLIQAEDLNANDIWMVDLSGTDVKRITRESVNPEMFFFSPDGEKIFYLTEEGKIFRATKEGESTPVPFKVTFLVDNAGFRRALMMQLWWALNDGFYDPNFHGVNWKAMFKKYLPYATSAYENRDFYIFVRFMLGELNASHLGIWGTGDEFNEKTGLLGIVPEKVKNGFRIRRVIYNTPAYINGLKKGDVITKIDGIKLDTIPNFYSALIGKRGKKVKLIVNGTDTLKVRCVSYGKLRNLIYREWAKWNREFVDSVSHGKLAYIHLIGMNLRTVKQFKRELYEQLDKEGLVLDIRYNGGGSTHDIILNLLRRTHYLYSVNRGEKEKEYSSLFSWNKPVVLLINSLCYSDAEIFPAGFKQLKLGKVVGMPTFGAVIGTKNITLFDGETVFRVPEEGWYRLTGRNLELGPVEPDIYVENPPIYDNRTGDPQLKTAIKILLEEVEE